MLPRAVTTAPDDDPFRTEVRDRRIARIATLTTPVSVVERYPLSSERAAQVVRHREEIQRVLNKEDDRLLVVVGPCSVHDAEAALDYANRLAGQADRLAEDLMITMRVYFEKPRTTTGWKGLINDPHLDGSLDVDTGLRTARKLLLDILATGLPVGTEWLDPITPQYISDTVAWGAIGARTTESQTHRQLGSGLSMPIGFKNRTDGNVQVEVDAVRASAVSHAFAGIDDAGRPAILHTAGNPDGHVILRGGSGAPNHGPAGVQSALSKLRGAKLAERLVIDASHDNSGKDHLRQPSVAAEIGDQVAAGSRAIVGVMLESFLVAGRQNVAAGHELTYGQSITDACMDWDATVGVLDGLAASVRDRRG
jgi:3-deoxy-7-phosphoheptulonate synthase